MNFRLLFICLFLIAGRVSGQNQNYQDQVWDFGDVAFWNNDTAWFMVRNATEKDLIFLPTYYNERFNVMFSSRAVGSGEAVRIGIVYYTEKAGKFNETLPLYINQRGEPIIFRLKGNIRGFNPNAQLRCPAVNADRSENRMEKVITLEVRDIETDELLIPDEIKVKTRYNQNIKLERSRQEYEMIASPGTYRVTALKKGYDDYLAVISLEAYQLRFVVYMQKSKEIGKIPDPVVAEDEPEDPIIVVTTGEAHTHPVDSAPRREYGSELSTDYRLNNVIMIVDVSSSMNRGGKYEALKSSFNTMVDALRPSDIITIISMNSNAEVIQTPTGVIEKDSLKSKVAGIKAIGGTNGGAALQLAYKLARDHFIADGNNQIIIATDGVFYGGTLTRKQIESMITEGNTENIHLSTVAFGSDPKALLFLGDLAAKGGGTMVQVGSNGEDELLLLEMIKSQSRRK